MSHKYAITSLSDTLKIKTKYKADFTTLYAEVFEYVYNHYEDSNAFKTNVVDVINNILFILYSEDSFPSDWDLRNDPFKYEFADDSDIEDVIGNVFLGTKDIHWDIHENRVEPDVVLNRTDFEKKEDTSVENTEPYEIKATPKEDLYLCQPTFPSFDADDYLTLISFTGQTSIIYKTRPRIPSKQAEISATTEVDELTDLDVLKLYPKCTIHTRAARMYEPCNGMKLHEDLGLILPIEGYTEEERIDNLIKYPHFYQLKRLLGDPLMTEDYRCFYYDIEIDGKLHPILQVWDELPESSIIPKDPEFVKEYVVRRYLLERDKGIEHNYPMLGDLQPHITLFMPFDKYSKLGQYDEVSLARTCVTNRVKYLQSLNPIFRQYGRCVDIDKCVFSGYCTRERCTAACPDLYQFSSLLTRNEIDIHDGVFKQNTSLYSDYAKLLKARNGTVSTLIIKKDAEPIANLLTYVGICLTWRGGAISNGVYHLHFYQYVEELQMSWGSDESETFRLMKIRSNDSRILVISQLDMVDFTNKVSQTLYVLLKERKRKNLTTIVVSPPLNKLTGKGHFYSMLVKELKEMSR